jgi:hypothetical protein
MELPTNRSNHRALGWPWRFMAHTAVAVAAAFLAGCSSSGGGTSYGQYSSAGSVVMTLSGTVVNGANNPLPGYGVSIDNSTPATTNAAGQYTLDIPTADIIVTGNEIRVYDNTGVLAHIEDRPINTANCVQTLAPIIVGPPQPPGVP